MTRVLALASIFTLALTGAALAQAQAVPGAPNYATKGLEQDGQAPGLKATELSPKTRSFQLIFAKGDEVEQGLTEFAEKNHIVNANFTAIGAFDHSVIGWSDPAKKAFKVIHLDEEVEVTSFTGNITRDKNGKAVVHAHCVVAALSNGKVYAGHFLEGHISLTMQLYMDVHDPLSTAQASAN